MAKITFNLEQNDNGDLVEMFATLHDCVNYVKLKINDPKNYTVNECEDGETVDCACAHYLLETYKDLCKLPKTLFYC